MTETNNNLNISSYEPDTLVIELFKQAVDGNDPEMQDAIYEVMNSSDWTNAKQNRGIKTEIR
ncbi:hypothetical protein SAMN04487897_11186 [Paenibacillus sp. yr247]|uniref:hypothetical protein n=1 Tax=Paenibacillus sp. yr247 TaxID=1761880 RepID=UPI0008894EA6|nr:hypothetical protein [Paenibacillus sp. yr247]SDO29178.1 hypothetical protein SAMN04487897_11186 [Paenibacillus sp. yr247]